MWMTDIETLKVVTFATEEDAQRSRAIWGPKVSVREHPDGGWAIWVPLGEES